MTNRDKTHMAWLNAPAAWNFRDGVLRATADPQTDFWRKTHDGGVRDSGHFFWRTVAGDFTARVAVRGDYNALYDQAGLMVRVDAKCWLKCGIELVDGVQQASVVVTRDWSDWSVRPIGTPDQIWLECVRVASTLQIAFSRDGQSYEMLRQTFLAEAPQLDVGLMFAAPQGNGFSVVFEQFSLTDCQTT